MGEIVCKKCGFVNWHVYCHVYGRCEECDAKIDWCDSCSVLIKTEDADKWIDALKNRKRFVDIDGKVVAVLDADKK